MKSEIGYFHWGSHWNVRIFVKIVQQQQNTIKQQQTMHTKIVFMPVFWM